jgi:integrase
MKEVRRHQRGYVFLKGASWYLRYYESEVQADGTVEMVQRCRKLADNKGAYRSKKAVRTLADEFLAPYNNGKVSAESSLSVEEFWDKKYLPYITDQKSPSTVDGYEKMWSRYLKDRIEMPVRDFRTVDCEHLLNVLVKKYDLCSTTLKHVKHLLSGVFRYAIRTGVLNGTNPVKDACIPKARGAGKTHAYSLGQILKMIEILPQPAKAIVAVAGFVGLRKGEISALRPGDYDGVSMKVQRAAWRGHIDKPKGKRGDGAVPVIPTAAAILNEHLATASPKTYIFETFREDPGNLDYVVSEVIRPTVLKAGIPWYGLHAFRRGLATNLHELGIADTVIQVILRHSDVSVTRSAYIKNDGLDSRSQAAMDALESAVCNQHATASSEAEVAQAVN